MYGYYITLECRIQRRTIEGGRLVTVISECLDRTADEIGYFA